MEIKPIDETRVNQSYLRLPKNLFVEIKNYMEDITFTQMYLGSLIPLSQAQWFV